MDCDRSGAMARGGGALCAETCDSRGFTAMLQQRGGASTFQKRQALGPSPRHCQPFPTPCRPTLPFTPATATPPPEAASQDAKQLFQGITTLGPPHLLFLPTPWAPHPFTPAAAAPLPEAASQDANVCEALTQQLVGSNHGPAATVGPIAYLPFLIKCWSSSSISIQSWTCSSWATNSWSEEQA